MSASFECSNCKETLPVPQAGADRFVTCPMCWNRVRAPEALPPAPPASEATTKTDGKAGAAFGPGPTELPPPLPTDPSLPPPISVDPAPYPAKWQVTGRAALARTGRVTRYALIEAWAVACATASLLWRSIRFGIASGRLYMLEQKCRCTQLDLANEILRRQVGNQAVRESIHAIDEEIEKARAAKRPAARLLANRRDLLIRLVEAEVTNDGAGLQGSELQEVQSQQRKLDEQRSAVEPIRTDLLPPNPVEMRRAVLGIGIAVLAIIVFGLSGRSKYPSVNHGTDDAVVGVQSQSKKMGGEAGAGTALTAQAGSSSLDKEIALDLGNGVKLEMVLIPAGEFLMGSPDSDKDALSEEKPQHRVRITKPFFMGKYLVTQEQWDVVMGSNPSEFKGPKNPVESLSWDDCQKFLDKLNAKSHPGGGRFQLPSEAQWEYACRAGSTTKYCFGDEESGLGEYAWYNANSDSKTHPVGEKKSNRWGLYDMHGNEWEWCADWHNNDYYKESPTDDPTGAATGSFRVARGGGWSFPAAWARSAARHAFEPGGRCLALRVSQVPAEVFAETRVSESGSQEGNAVKTPPLSRSRDEDASKFQPVSAERTRAPRASSLYPIRESRESGVSELRADLGVVDKGSDYQASCSLVYDYFGASVPTTVDWKQFEVVISVKSTIRVENNPLGGLWKRGKVGYGGSRITIKIDEEVYGGKADFNSEEHGDLMYERLAVSITKEVATAIRDAKSVSIIAGSADLPLIFHLDDEMVGAFRNLIDRVARSR